MTATFYVGDVLDVLGKLPENSVDLVLSSPPFLSLRSYLPPDHPDKHLEGGSQATPGEYIDWLLDVVEACDRVLAPHGSLCFELGDTYAGSGGAGGDYNEGGLRDRQPRFQGSAERDLSWTRGWTGANRDGASGGSGWPLPKSLSLIPESFRFAMVYGFNPFTGRQTERWRLRNVIRWVRPNPPVGALGDKFRPATSELMVFCKSAKRYFDLDAVREAHTNPRELERVYNNKRNVAPGDNRGDEHGVYIVGNRRSNPVGSPPLDWWNIPLLEGEEPTKYGPKPRDITKGIPNRALAHSPTKGNSWGDEETKIMYENPAGAPPLDWWNIPPGGYEGAHYAVWPPELLIKPIKAMCPEKVCRTCGEARRRIVGEADYVNSNTGKPVTTLHFTGERRQGGENHWDTEGQGDRAATRIAPTLGFTDCGHNDYRNGVVLDCFGGSGTTASVATGHGRDCILIDLDERNFDLALERVGPLVLQRGEVAA